MVVELIVPSHEGIIMEVVGTKFIPSKVKVFDKPAETDCIILVVTYGIGLLEIHQVKVKITPVPELVTEILDEPIIFD